MTAPTHYLVLDTERCVAVFEHRSNALECAALAGNTFKACDCDHAKDHAPKVTLEEEG